MRDLNNDEVEMLDATDEVADGYEDGDELDPDLLADFPVSTN